MNKIIVFIFLVFFITFYVPSLEAQFTHPKKKILLVVAMDTEALPLIHALKLKKSSQFFSGLPMRGYIGKYHNINIFLITNGKDPVYQVQNVGTQAATLTTYLGIAYFHPDLVISIGTAGGVAQNGAKIGDIYLSKKIYFYDRRIPISDYKEYGMGGYASADFGQMIRSMNFKQGVICSGDSFDADHTDTETILKMDCSVREMEAAGVAWVSMLMKTPMLAMKGITDIVGTKNGHDDFEKNFSRVNDELSQQLKAFLSRFSVAAHQ